MERKRKVGRVRACWAHLCLWLCLMQRLVMTLQVRQRFPSGCCGLMCLFPLRRRQRSNRVRGERAEGRAEGRADGEGATVKAPPDRFCTCGHSAAGPDVKHPEGSPCTSRPINRCVTGLGSIRRFCNLLQKGQNKQFQLIFDLKEPHRGEKQQTWSLFM